MALVKVRVSFVIEDFALDAVDEQDVYENKRLIEKVKEMAVEGIEILDAEYDQPEPDEDRYDEEMIEEEKKEIGE